MSKHNKIRGITRIILHEQEQCLLNPYLDRKRSTKKNTKENSTQFDHVLYE